MGDCALPDYSEDEYSETFEDSNDEDSAPGMDNFRHNDGRSTRLNGELYLSCALCRRFI